MLKEATYKEKFVLLADWLPVIIEAIQKDLKNDHLKKDARFVKNFFANKNPSKLTREELLTGYSQALQNEEYAEPLGEFIANRWMIRHTDLYHFFEERLRRINPNFTEMTEIEPTAARSLMEDAIEEFGARNVYLFSIINSVVFPNQIYDQLRRRALESVETETAAAQAQAEHRSIEEMQQSHQQQIARLTDKYEKKIQGMQKKYLLDVDALKKQIASLQRKLHGQ